MNPSTFRLGEVGSVVFGDPSSPDAAIGDILWVWDDASKAWTTKKLPASGGGPVSFASPEVLSYLLEYPVTIIPGQGTSGITGNLAGGCVMPIITPPPGWPAGLMWSVAFNLDSTALRISLFNASADPITIDVDFRDWSIVRAFLT